MARHLQETETDYLTMGDRWRGEWIDRMLYMWRGCLGCEEKGRNAVNGMPAWSPPIALPPIGHLRFTKVMSRG